MLEALENQIVEYFREHPGTEYISSELSSYERLLVHAASSYNKLDSRSFDKNGKRILVVQNRNKKNTFCPVDPSLSKYLKIRGGKLGKKYELNLFYNVMYIDIVIAHSNLCI